MDNKNFLLNNVGAIELTLFDNNAFEAISNKKNELNITQSTFINPDVTLKIANLRNNIIEKISAKFKIQVTNADKIDDPEQFVKSFNVLEGRPIANREVDLFNWLDLADENFVTILNQIEDRFFPEHSSQVNQIIQKYLNNKYHQMQILNFTEQDFLNANEEINNLLEDQKIDAHPDLPFVGYTINEIQEELQHDYKKWCENQDNLWEIIIKAAYENGINANKNYPDEAKAIINSELNKLTIKASDVGLNKLQEILSNTSTINEIEVDDEGYPLLDNFFEQCICSNGNVYQAIYNFAYNYDYANIINDIKPILINELANPTYDNGTINVDDATNILNTLYPGTRILEVDQDVLDDLRMEYA